MNPDTNMGGDAAVAGEAVERHCPERSSASPAGDHVCVGSRDSSLALKQTHHVIALLHESDTAPVKYEVQSMKTLGDRILDVALPKIGDKGLFTKDLEAALSCKAVDFVVHSYKDVPSALPENMVIAAILEREDPYDVVILHPKHEGKVTCLADLPEGAVLGTSSVRRAAQLLRLYPRFTTKSVRGNLNTRLAKLDEHDDYDCLILAAAGIKRLGFESRISMTLSKEEMLYAIGQGALAVECRKDDAQTRARLSRLVHTPTLLAVTAERSLMKRLGGGCSVPLGVDTCWQDGQLVMEAGVFQHDGSAQLRKATSAVVTTADAAVALGEVLAAELLAAGARAILDSSRAAVGVGQDPRTKPAPPAADTHGRQE